MRRLFQHVRKPVAPKNSLICFQKTGREQVMQSHPQAEDVAARIAMAPLSLRSAIAGGTTPTMLRRRLQTGEAEIGQPDAIARILEQVGRLDVLVEVVGLVRVGQ